MSQLLLSALGLVCPTCDGYNPPLAQVCSHCGTSLEEVPAMAQSPATRSDSSLPAPQGARSAGAAMSSNARLAAAAAARSSEAVPPGLRPAARTPLATVPTPAAGARPGASASPEPPPRITPLSTPAVQPAVAPAIPPVTAPAPAASAATASPRSATAPGAAPAAAARLAGARPAPAASRFGLTVISGAARGQRFKVPVTGCNVGRTRGAILFGEDAFLSALHATFLVHDSALFVRDESSASGVFVTIAGSEEIAPLAFFSAGQRLFRFNGRLEPQPPLSGRPTTYGAPLPSGSSAYGVEEILVGGRGGRAVVTGAPLLTIGQGRCDLSYPQDEGLAARHCELSPAPSGALLRDLSGGLGTFVRIAPAQERPLRPGERVRLGQHVLQVELLG